MTQLYSEQRSNLPLTSVAFMEDHVFAGSADFKYNFVPILRNDGPLDYLTWFMKKLMWILIEILMLYAFVMLIGK